MCEWVYRHTNKKGDVQECNVCVYVTRVYVRVRQEESALAKLLEEKLLTKLNYHY
jgi:hypothetical protein